jgi:hypothetical protein
MLLVGTVVVLLIGLFMCIVNMIYSIMERKSPSQWKKYSILSSPGAWGLYAFCIAITLIVLATYSIGGIAGRSSNIDKQLNNITQQQQDTSNEQQGNTQTK